MLPMREAEGIGDAHEHGHEEHHADEGGEHDNHDNKAGHEEHDNHESDVGHVEHAHDHHGDVDPHGRLSPSNAVLWAGAIAQNLAEIDPANAQIYSHNWETMRDEIGALKQDLSDMLAPYHDTPFVVLHDAFHYFEATFGVEAQAFIVPSDGQSPGLAGLKALRDYLVEQPAVCAFTAPQENDALLRTALEGQGTRIAALDTMRDGEMRYTAFLQGFAKDMTDCFAASEG
jgi:zinc transport system substrate-binding protein